MKAIISSTYSDTYLFYLPITIWAWNKIGVGVVCFLPETKKDNDENKINLITKILADNKADCLFYTFKAPEHKEATYSQCSRLYGAAIKSIPEDEILITSDVDMAVFGEYLKQYDGNIQLFGADLLEGEKMYPMCYCSATVGQWKEFMGIGNKSYQQCLDEMLGDIDCEHMRGNYWRADQEKLFNSITTSIIPTTKHNRAKLPERFATLRYDRDDFFILNRLNNDTVDYHMNRPGYEPQNFDIILKVFQYHYPNDGFDWMVDYTNKYKGLL